MKKFDSRAYSINDIFEWYRNKQLELSPRFQRGSVWTDHARSYLMDTIIQGKPIPKIFIRQKLNPTTHIAIREVVDGQQRLRTILSFLADGFKIRKSHNEEYGGLFYSQLDPEIQDNILNYELSTDLLINISDPEVLDIFGRLNSYAVVLNEQEKINSNHFSPFKMLADKLGHTYFDFWINNKILSESQIIRMGDVTLVADMLIASMVGIKSKKSIRNYYDEYEKDSFDFPGIELESQFRITLEDISKTFEDGLKKSELHRIHLFYSLFTAFYHLRWGLKDLQKVEFDNWNYSQIRNKLSVVEKIFDADNKKLLSDEEEQFLVDSRRATTDALVRTRRTNFLVSLILEDK